MQARVWAALIAQYKSLIAQNISLGEHGSNGQWLDFNFTFPQYDETNHFVVLDKFVRQSPPPLQSKQRSGASIFARKLHWYEMENGQAGDPNKLMIKMNNAGEPMGVPEVYYPSEDEGDGEGPEVWKRWWPVVNPPAGGEGDVDMDMGP